jgi:hypothetical protein
MQCDLAPGSSLRDRLPAPGSDVKGAEAAIAVWAIAHGFHPSNAMRLGT